MATPGKAPATKAAPAKKVVSAKKVVAKKIKDPDVSAKAPTTAAKSRNVWDYIKKNTLQDNIKRPIVNADAKLK